MKVKEFLPALPEIIKKEQEFDALTRRLSDVWLQKAGEVFHTPSLGISQNVMNAWLRQQMSYRQQMLNDLLTIALTIEEIRSPILRITAEVFRKGIQWVPKFAAMCEQCQTEYSQNLDECKKCKSNEHLRLPDESQKDIPDNFLSDCNIFDQSLEEILRGVHFDVNVCLIPGTKILTHHSRSPMKYKSIEDIKIGDNVWTHRGRIRKVLKTYKRFVDEEIFYLHLVGNVDIGITGEHLILTRDDGWVKAKDLTVGSILLKVTECHPTWAEKHRKKEILKTISKMEKDRKKICKKQQETRRKREAIGVIYHGSLGHAPYLKNRTYQDAFGQDKAKEIIEKIRTTREKNGANVGAGYHFRSKIGDFNGSNNPNWNGGISFLPYASSFNKAMKCKILERDNYVCQLCNKTNDLEMRNMGTRLSVHHIDYDKKNCNEFNLITLCRACNSEVNSDRQHWNQFFTEKLSSSLAIISNGTKIIAITKRRYTGFVYNLEVEEDNTYAGAGLIYHNCDDAYVYLAKEYHGGDGEETIHSKVTEIRRLEPSAVEIDLDSNGLPKNSNFLCYIHRDDPRNAPGKCKECDRQLVPAMYKYWHRGKALYLLDSEVIHIMKFNPSETYGWSPVLTIFEKALSIRGMDSFLYRYFFERRMPSAMIMVFTDDPESLRRERENIAARTRSDPNYVPMIAVSSRNNRGRVDLVRLFHTLQEMDYLPVRQEIRERIASMWGVTPAWQGSPDAFGGLSSQTQQLTVMSRVVESDQRMYNEKVFPLILEAFGVTDWLWELRQPEEKAESTRLSFAQQRISAANLLFNMGFDVQLKSHDPGIENIDFVVSGKAEKPQTGGFGGGFGGPSSEAGSEEQGISLMEKANGWIEQIQNAGYEFQDIKGISNSGDAIWFEAKGKPYIAKFVDGNLLDIEKIIYPKMHQHGSHPIHDVNIPHNTMARQDASQENVYRDVDIEDAREE